MRGKAAHSWLNAYRFPMRKFMLWRSNGSFYIDFHHLATAILCPSGKAAAYFANISDNESVNDIQKHDERPGHRKGFAVFIGQNIFCTIFFVAKKKGTAQGR